MLQEQALIDVALAVGLLEDDPSGEGYRLVETWIERPLAATHAALASAARRELLVEALEAILERRDGQSALLTDGVATVAIPQTPMLLLLRHDGQRIQLGVGAAYDDPAGRLTLGFHVYLLSYDPTHGADPFDVFDRLELTAQLSLTPDPGADPSARPFQRGLFRIDYSDLPGSNNARARISARLDGLKGCATDPILAEFTLEPVANPQGWEGQLLRIALTGVQVALGHLVMASGPSAAVKKVGTTLYDHLLPLFGLQPADVAGVGSGFSLPALPLEALLRAPRSALQGWLHAVFSDDLRRRDHAITFLTHLSQLLTLGEAGPVATPSTTLSVTDGCAAWIAPLGAAPGAGPIPGLLLWVEPDPSCGHRLCLGLHLQQSVPALGAAQSAPLAPYLHAQPLLELSLELLSVPLSGSLPVRLAREAELRASLNPIHSGYILEHVQIPGASPQGSASPNDVLTHLRAFEGGLRLEDGQRLVPFLELVDLQLGTQTPWQRINLLSSSALVEVGTSAAVETLTDALTAWLGQGIGEAVVRLVGLRAPTSLPPGAPAWPLVVPAGAQGQTDPQALEKIRRLLSDLPGTYADWAFRLLEPAPTGRPLAQWLRELEGLLNLLYDDQGPVSALRGVGTPSNPWRLALLPPGAGSPFELDLTLKVAVREEGPVRRLSAVVVLDLLKAQEGQTWLTSGARLRLLDLALEPGQGGFALAREARLLSELSAGVSLDSGLVLSPPSLNPPGATRAVRVELGEAEAALAWQRGNAPGFRLEATAARIPNPTQPAAPDVLTGPTFCLRDLELEGALGDLPVHLLTGAFALDEAAVFENDPALRELSDGLLGLCRFMGWVPQALLPGGWPGLAPVSGGAFAPGLHTLPELEQFFQGEGVEGLLTLLLRRMCNPAEDVAGVGGQAALDHLGAWVQGKVAPLLLGQAVTLARAPSQFRAGAGTWEDPFFVTLACNKAGLPVLELVCWRVTSGQSLTHFGLGLRSLLVDSTGTGASAVEVEGSLRVDLVEIARQAASPAERFRLLPMNLSYDCNIGRKDRSPLWSTGNPGSSGRSEAGTLRMRLRWTEPTGLEPALVLTDALCQGQGPSGASKGTVPLSSPLAAPLLSGIQGMGDSPFKSGSGSVKAMLNVIAALGLVTLDAGGGGGFLAAPISGLDNNPSGYLKSQFIDPNTGVLRLGTLVHALEGDPGSTNGLLQLLGLKRLPGEGGLDLSVTPDGALRFTAVERRNNQDLTWLDVSWNPLSKGLSFDVHYPPGGDPAGAFCHFSNAASGAARPFALWAEVDIPIVQKLLGTSRLDLVPPDWRTIFRLMSIALGAVGTALGIYALLKKVAEPAMKRAAPATVDFFVAAGWLKQGANGLRIPKIMELIKEGADLPDKLLAQATVGKLDTALGVHRFFRQTFQLSMVSDAQRADLSVGTTRDPLPPPGTPGDWPYGRNTLGKGFGLELLLKAGAAFKSNALDTGAFAGQVVLGTHALWGSQSFGLRGEMDFAGALKVDLVMKGAGAQSDSAFPLYPSFGLSGLAGFLGLTQSGGRALMILGLEALVKALDEYVANPPAQNNPHPRDLVAHFLGGLGVLTQGADTRPDFTQLEQGRVTIDPAAFARLLPAGPPSTPPWPQPMLAQLDEFWLTEALMDLASMFRLPVVTPGQGGNLGAGGPGGAQLKGAPVVSGRHVLWTLVEKASGPRFELALIAGNYPTLHPDQGGTGIGLRLHLEQPTPDGFELFELGWEDKPVLWAWLENNNGQWRVLLEALLQVIAVLPLPTSDHLVREEVFGGGKLVRGDFEPRLRLRLESGRRDPLPAPHQAHRALATRGIQLEIFPSPVLTGCSTLEYSPRRQPPGVQVPVTAVMTTPTTGKVDGIVSLAASFVADVVLFEASDGRAKILDLDLPFIEPSLGQVLGSVRDKNRDEISRRRWFDQGAGWSSPLNPAYINPKHVLPDLLEGLRGAGGSQQKMAPTSTGNQKSAMGDVAQSVALATGPNNLYGLQLRRRESVPIVPFASLVLGQEALLDEEVPLTLWLVQLRSPVMGDPDWNIAFKPGVTLRDLGVKFHGKDGRPLIDRGKVQLDAVMVAGSLHVGEGIGAGAAFGGAKLVISELALPLGRARGDTPANRLLADDGTNPGVSLWASWGYEARGEKLRLGFVGGEVDERGVHWFQVRNRKGEADVGRIGVRYQENAAVPADGRASVLVDGRFRLGPLKVQVEDFGVDFALRNTFRPAQWDVHLEGLGISYTSETVSVLGALKHTTQPEGYVGAALVNVKALELSALAAWSKIPIPGSSATMTSLFVFARVSATPGLGGPPFFFVKGVAGGFGYNRAFILPQDPAQLSNQPLIVAMKPPPGVTAMQLIDDIQRSLPPRQNAYWLALGVDFTCFKLIAAKAILYVALDQGFTMGLFGLATFSQPEGKPLVNVELAFDAGFSTTDNDPRLWVKAALTRNSWLLTPDCRLTGGFALCAWFKRRDMVLTIGGYHRDFVVPPHYPQVERVGLLYQVSDKLRISGETYFALTPREMMGGMKMLASYEGKTIFAYFHSYFDWRLGWDPFFYDLQWGIQVTGGIRNVLTLTVGARIHAWGPPFGGTAAVTICRIEVRFDFGKPKAAVQTQLSLDDTLKKHVLQKEASHNLATSPLWTAIPGGLAFKESARLSATWGRLPEPGQSPSAPPPDSPVTALRLDSEFGLELGLCAPATEVRIPGMASPLPVTVPSPSGETVRTAAFDPVDLVMARVENQRLPLVMRLRRVGGAVSPTAAPGADVVPLGDGARFELKATAGYFPSAVYANPPMTTVNYPLVGPMQVPDYNRQEMTLPMVETVSLRFKKQRGAGMSFNAAPETASAGLPLTEIFPVMVDPGSTQGKAMNDAQARSDGGGAPPAKTAAAPAPALTLSQALKTPTAPATQAAQGTSNLKSASTTPTRSSFELVAGAMVRVDLENLPRGATSALRLSATGDQALRVVGTNRSGHIVSAVELGPGAPPFTLPAGASALTLVGLGRPPAAGPDGKPLAPSASPGLADYSRYTGSGQLTAVGVNPEDRLLHLGRGVLLCRGAHLTVHSTLAAPPALGYCPAAGALAPVRSFTAGLPAFLGTMVLHLRPAAGQVALTDPAGVHNRVARATTGTIRRFMAAGQVQLGGELAVLYDVDAPGAWSLWVELKGTETLAGISLLPGPVSSWAAQLAQGLGWTAVDDAPLSREGRSSVVVEVIGAQGGSR